MHLDYNEMQFKFLKTFREIWVSNSFHMLMLSVNYAYKSHLEAL